MNLEENIDSGVQPYLFPRLEPILRSEYTSLHFHYLYLKSQTYIKYFWIIIIIFYILYNWAKQVWNTFVIIFLLFILQ